MEKATRKVDEHTASWYIIYTAARAEEYVDKQLKQSHFETYLPLRPVVRIWNGRERRIMIPFIPRIVFVCLSKNDIEQTSTTLSKGSFLLREKEQYISISIEQMKVLRDAIEQTNRLVEFTVEEFDINAKVDDQSPIPAEKAVLQSYLEKFRLPIEGLGVILVKAEDSIH